jgi:hypothetical protein
MAVDLGGAIEHASAKYSVCPETMRAVAFIESRHNIKVKPRFNTNNTYDVGVFQINTVHWDTTCKEFDIWTLQGNALCAAKILSKIEKYKYVDEYYLGRYHSKTPKLKINYAKKIKRAKVFLKKSE